LISFYVGGHELKDCRAIIQDLAGRMKKKPLFVSDELEHYRTILAETYSTTLPSKPTCKRGRPKNPEKVIDYDLHYATVRKTRQGGKIVNVTRSIVFGSQADIANRLEKSPSRTINTSYVERSNADWRLWDSHLTRKSYTFAHSKSMLKAKLAITITSYNLIRPHATLTKMEERKVKTTPAMAAKLTDHPWTYDEVLTTHFVC
jgi:hypothetical protein